MRLGPALALAALLLAGCDDPKPANRAAAPAPAAPAALEGRQAEALRATEERLRARLRSDGPLTQRAVVVHRQAMAGTLAVCGQVNASGRGDDPFIPYVGIVAFEGDQPPRVEFHIGASSPEATRVYVVMLDRCWDGGGPTTQRTAGRALPPVPSALPATLPPERPGVPPGSPAAAPASAPASATGATAPASIAPVGPAQGMVTTSARTPVNIRETPGGGAAVMRVVPRGSSLQVFGEAPGGWLQVGEGEPWGWLHSSMLESR